MKNLFLLALLLSTLPAHAILIEDSPERLVFDVTWDNGWTSLDGGGTGTNGSRVMNLGNEWSRNRYKYLFEIHWMADGVFRPTTVLQVSFRTDPEDNSPMPDTVLGSPWLSLQPSPWVLALEGNPHGARIIIGQPYAVPDTGSTIGLLAVAFFLLMGHAPICAMRR